MSKSSVCVVLLLCFGKSHSKNDFFISEQKRELACVTNTSFALTWIPEDNYYRGVPFKQVSTFVPSGELHPFNCHILNDEQTKNYFEKSPWTLRDLLEWTSADIILDQRWEEMDDLETNYRRSGSLEYLPVLSPVQKDFDIPFSIRTQYEAHVFLCDGDSPPVSNCYWFMLQAFKGAKSAIRKCKKFEIPNANSQYAVKNSCQNLLVEVQHPNYTTYLSNDRWSHFKLRKKGNILTFLQANQSGDKKILELEDKEEVINVTSMVVHSKLVEAFWKIHHIEFIYTNEETDYINLGPPIELRTNSICISVYLSMCEFCQMKLTLVGRNSTLGEKTYKSEHLGWTQIKFMVDDIPEAHSDVRLLVSTIGKDKTFWALDNFRICQKEEFRAIHTFENAKCQLMSGNNNVISIEKPAEISESECPEDTIGPFCVPCFSLYNDCGTIKICTNEKCFCSAGYEGDCLYPCLSGYYGHGCRKQCGHCFDPTYSSYSSSFCHNIDGTCSNGRCSDNYSGPKCDTAPILIFKEPPKISEVSYTAVIVEINNFEVEAPLNNSQLLTYSLQYKTGRDRNAKWKYVSRNNKFYRSQNITIDGLEPGTLYSLRSVITIQNQTYDDNVKVATFTTECEDISDSNIQIRASNTSAFVSLLNVTAIKCKLNTYNISTTKSKKPTFLNQTSLIFDKLNPWTNYSLIFERGSKRLNKSFGTSEGVPKTIQNFRTTYISPTTIRLTWQEPVSLHGKLKHYVVEYQLLSYIACSSMNASSKYRLLTVDTSIKISNLSPYSRYLFSVKATNSKFEGPASQLSQSTPSVDKLQVEELPRDIKYIADDSKVTLELAVNCTKIHGPLLAKVRLNCSNEWCRSPGTVYQQWPFTTTVLTNLYAFTDYNADFEFCRNTCTDVHLKQQFKTQPKVPNRVTELLVYSKNTSSVSLRWKPPYPPNGVLKQYHIEYEQDEITVGKTPCKLWPQLHCATITNLDENTNVNFMVSARNEDPSTLGPSSSIRATTRIEKSEAPYGLIIKWSLYNDLELEWKHPNQTSGEVRSFTLVITQSRTTQIRREVPVTENAPTYHFKMNASEVLPSTLYSIQISANNGYDGETAKARDTSPPSIPILKQDPTITTSDSSITVEVVPDFFNKTEQNKYGLRLLISDASATLEKIQEKECFPNSKIVYELNSFNHAVSVVLGTNTNISFVAGTNHNITVIVTNSFGKKTSLKMYCFSTAISTFNSALLSLLLLLLVIPAVIIFLKRRQQCLKDGALEYSYPLATLGNGQQAEGKNLSNAFSKIIKVSEFEEYVKKSENTDELAIQYQMVLNNQNSVTYAEIHETQYFDYVDMEFSDGFKIPRAYIIAEVPKTETINSFWETIWEENVLHILLLTSSKEQSREKYFPSKNEKLECGAISVQMAFSKNIANYEYKTFILIIKEQIRHVDQIDFQYHGLNAHQFVPLFRKMLRFSLKLHSPILIQSNGDFERMGFVLLCDMCLRMAEKENVVDVWKNLKHLSDHNMDLVCNSEMYKLAHGVVFEYLYNDEEDVDLNIIYENF